MTSAHSDQRRMMALAWPAIVENLSNTLVIFIDSAMVGSLGAAATAAVGINASPSWLMAGLAMATGVGATALVARASGAGDDSLTREVAWHSLAVGALLSFLLMLFSVFGAHLVPIWLGAQQEIHRDAAGYLRIVGYSAIPRYLGMIAGALLRGTGDTKTPMRATLLSHVVNVTFNFLLIFPARQMEVLGMHFTMPGAGLGVSGAAIATALSFIAMGCYQLYMLMLHKGGMQLWQHRIATLSKDVFRRLLRLSVPAALERMSINLGQIVFAGMVTSFGTAALAAHHLSITIESLGYMPGFGFSVAAATLVGQALGRQEPDVAKSMGQRAIMTGTIAMSCIGIAMFFLADLLISLFTPDPEVRRIGAGLIRICAFEQPFSALSIIAPGALRGAGDTRSPFLVSVISMWGVRIVFAWLLGMVLGLGVQGIWVAMLLDLAVRGLLLYARFLRGHWQQLRV